MHEGLAFKMLKRLIHFGASGSGITFEQVFILHDCLVVCLIAAEGHKGSKKLTGQGAGRNITTWQDTVIRG